MKKTLDFYFDYSSPYGYLASERIEALAARHQHEVVWRPVLLGAIFKITGQSPLLDQPLKGDYSSKDIARTAREHKLDYHHPQPFPIAAIAASRATVWFRDNADSEIRANTGAFVHSLYRAYFTLGKNITEADIVAEAATPFGVASNTLLQAISEQSAKDALRREVDEAVKAGVFGSPMMIVDGEAFWGDDRLDQMERWLERGGW